MTLTYSHDSDLVGMVTEMAVETQAAGLRLLEAELRALVQIVPGTQGDGPVPSQAEVEAGFDNMPV